jgi:uncharacterized protein YigA (DUF484 family)
MTTSFTNPITEDDIANYLANTPDFFERHAELLAAVQLSSPHSSRAVSLQERQAQMLRDKIKALEARVMDMIRHGNENAILSDKLLQWARSLFLTADSLALPAQIAREIQDQFSVPQVGIKVWGVAPQYAATPFAQDVSEDAKLFASSLVEPFCGVNTGFEAVGWLAEPQAATSLALLPLRLAPPGSATSACWCWPRPMRNASTVPWAPTFWRALANWPAPRCQDCVKGIQRLTRFLFWVFVIPDMIRDPVPRLHWIAGQARNDKSGCHCGLYSKSIGRTLPGARARGKAAGATHGGTLFARFAEASGLCSTRRCRAGIGSKQPHPALGRPDAQRRAQWPRHCTDFVGLARLLYLARA